MKDFRCNAPLEVWFWRWSNIYRGAGGGRGVRPWGGGGAIDYCPCYGQIAFYWLITFSCHRHQQHGLGNRLKTHSGKKSDHKLSHEIRRLRLQVGDPSVKSILNCLLLWYLSVARFVISPYPSSTLAPSLTSNPFHASKKAWQCCYGPEKAVQRHQAQLDMILKQVHI